jgi:hypothetical protein
MFEAVNGINTSYRFEAVNGVNTKPFEAVNGMSHVHVKHIVNNQADISQPTVAKTSEGDEVNIVINAHDKHIVTGQVMFSDGWDSEIQNKCLDESKPLPNKWQMPDKINLDSTSFKKINRSLTHAFLVLFSSFGAISAELKRGVHPHQVLATSSSKQAGGNASTQSHGLRHDKNSEQVKGNQSTQPRGLCL